MARFKLRRGSSVPTAIDLEEYEIGINTSDKNLYTNIGGIITQTGGDNGITTDNVLTKNDIGGEVDYFSQIDADNTFRIGYYNGSESRWENTLHFRFNGISYTDLNGVAYDIYTEEDPVVLSNTIGGADKVEYIVSLTQAEFNSLTRDPSTVYIIVG